MVMNPSQLPTSPQPPTGQYDFILAPESQKRKFSGGSTKSRLIFVGVIVIVLVLVGSILASILSSAGNQDVKSIKKLVAQQEELVRITELGSDRAQDYKIRSLAYTTKLSILTQQQKLLSYLEERGSDPSKEELAAELQPKLEAELEQAASNNRFDETFSAALDTALRAYAKETEVASKNVGSEKTKAVLKESYASSLTLLGIAG
jgi:flagellar basal body-associated protein FliL